MIDPLLAADEEPGLSAAPPSYLSGLNPEQLLAVQTTEGPVLVLAGAGTGKTRVLTSRLAHILASGRARPWQVLAVTFTNRAAGEMRERVAAISGADAGKLWLGTFHSVGVRILRAHADKVGLRPNFTVLDADDQLRLLKQVMADANLDPKRYPPPMVLAAIQGWKDRGLTPDKVPDEDDRAEGKAIGLYRLYQQRLLTVNATDFGDLLLLVLELFTHNADILTQYQERFRYILVDEYQDTNVAQYLWLRLLARKNGNLCCVGDDDQSIYSWRGAEIDNILRFEHDFPGATVIRLERNYRSTPHILAAASGLIAHNDGRLGKTLMPGRPADPGSTKVELRGVWNGEEEARFVAERIAELERHGQRLSEIAILVRAGFQTREFEERLMRVGLAYRVVGGPRFYERQEIRDALAYLRVIAQSADSLAFERIVNLPKRGIGDSTLQVVHKLARAQNLPLVDAVRRLLDTDDLKPRPKATLSALLDQFAAWAKLAEILSPAELAKTVLDQSGYLAMWRADPAPDAPGRVDNLKELVAALESFDSLTAFLEHVSLVMENDAQAGAEKISLMTLHGAKGLEFDVVFLPGWEEGLFPHPRALDEQGMRGLEEERRLAYVGLTRARERAIISHAAERRVYNQWMHPPPSRFLEELPGEHVERAQIRGLDARPPGLAERDTAWSAPKPAKPAATFQPGDRVFHQKFGYGRVLISDAGKLDIEFDKAGMKKVIDSFVAKA
ncbi:MAG: UvrD-helicase domain-containing protein [Rhodospirillales bacterium]|nr:UvrD-helicase domain-containing protein [Rhodospirillales bacterium]